MPTELPPRKIVQPESSASGTLAFAVAVLLMLVISASMLMHPVGIVEEIAQAQGL